VEIEPWQVQLLSNLSAPAWLSDGGTDHDVVQSSRIRYARNIRGFRFPTTASASELSEILGQVRSSISRAQLRLKEWQDLSDAARDYLVHTRLISPGFSLQGAQQGLYMTEDRSVSLMVNEEDHLRLQVLTPGWSLDDGVRMGDATIRPLEEHLVFAKADGIGYLTASPSNQGDGVRCSVMMHLLGLASRRQLAKVLEAAVERGITARGLFGEHSRAVGHFFQISVHHRADPAFRGAVEFLMDREREARASLGADQVIAPLRAAAEFAVVSRRLQYVDSLRVLSWARLGACLGLDGCPSSPREVDRWILGLEAKGSHSALVAEKFRAGLVREKVEPILRALTKK
jgi:protein arginine kinase